MIRSNGSGSEECRRRSSGNARQAGGEKEKERHFTKARPTTDDKRKRTECSAWQLKQRTEELLITAKRPMSQSRREERGRGGAPPPGRSLGGQLGEPDTRTGPGRAEEHGAPGATARPIIRRWPCPPQSDPPPRPAGQSDPAPSLSSLRNNRDCVHPQMDGDDWRKIKEGGGTGGGVEEGRGEAGKQEEVEVEGQGEEGTGGTEELRGVRAPQV